MPTWGRSRVPEDRGSICGLPVASWPARAVLMLSPAQVTLHRLRVVKVHLAVLRLLDFSNWRSWNICLLWVVWITKDYQIWSLLVNQECFKCLCSVGLRHRVGRSSFPPFLCSFPSHPLPQPWSPVSRTSDKRGFVAALEVERTFMKRVVFQTWKWSRGNSSR